MVRNPSPVLFQVSEVGETAEVSLVTSLHDLAGVHLQRKDYAAAAALLTEAHDYLLTEHGDEPHASTASTAKPRNPRHFDSFEGGRSGVSETFRTKSSVL